MYSFSCLEPVCCSMSSYNCCFLTCIQVSQAGQMVWYSHLFQNFPQFIVIHTVKDFGIVNKAEINVFFWNSLAFSMSQQMLAVWSLVPLPLLKSTWIYGSSWFTYCWSLAWRIWSITLLACEMSTIVRQFEHCLALPFFGIGMKTYLFHSCGPCWAFQICWYIECRTFTASSFRIEIAQLEFHHFHQFCSSWCFLRCTWLHIPVYLALGEWSHHHDYLDHEGLFCAVFLCILATSS